MLALALLASLPALERAGAQAAEGVQLSVEHCAGPPFDLEAYAKALEVELKVLNAASLVPGSAPDGARGPQLIVTLPGCADELQVTLRVRDREATDDLRAGDFAGVGQARALALATIEALRVLSLRLQAQPPPEAAAASASAAPTAMDPPLAGPPAAPEPVELGPSDSERAPVEPKSTELKPEVPLPEPERPIAPQVEPLPERPTPGGPAPWLALHVRGGAGALGALDAHVHAGAALRLFSSVWVKAELGYGQVLERTALGAVRARQATLGALLEVRLRPFAPLELWVATGLRAGLTVVSAELELALPSARSAREVLALLLHAPLELGAALDVGEGLIVGLFVEPGVWLAGARFVGPTAADLGMPGRDAAPPRLELLGPSLQAGLMLGYRF